MMSLIIDNNNGTSVDVKINKNTYNIQDLWSATRNKHYRSMSSLSES